MGSAPEPRAESIADLLEIIGNRARGAQYTREYGWLTGGDTAPEPAPAAGRATEQAADQEQ